MIFIDSNIPMYLIGQDHPHKGESIVLLEKMVIEKKRLVTSLEVFQEILHRYTSINKKEAISPAFDSLYKIVDEVFEVKEEDILETKNLLLTTENLSSRDALHACLMKRLKIEFIFSFDRGFDSLPFIKRLP